MELETWSSTSSHSATLSWQTPWLKNTSRSSWASQSMCTQGLTLSVNWQKVSFCGLPAISLPLEYAKSLLVFVVEGWALLLYSRRKKTADFLRDAVETRLRMYIPYIESWPQVHWVCYTAGLQDASRPQSDPFTLCVYPQAMSILLLPHNIPDSLKHLSNLMDDIWYYAGDRSTDVSGSHHPRSSPSSTHTFLSPFHHHPRNLRPATSQVTFSHRTRLFIPNWNCSRRKLLLLFIYRCKLPLQNHCLTSLFILDELVH